MSREAERPNEVTAYHLAGWAGCYTRQSSERQVQENKGSLEYQRGQAQWARRWGWPDEAIKPYEDAGLSGVAADHRPAFLAMIADIKATRLRAVFAADQSRLARNSIEWVTFLETCRVNTVLLCIDGRLVRLGDDGDEFSSRIVALVDEFENKKRRATFQRGILGKIEGGKAVTAPPTGYVSCGDGRWDLDPDTEIQTGIAEVFRVFLTERSCARTARELKRLGRRIPRRKPGRAVRWVEPNLRAVLAILRNPAYSGTYVYRQRVVDASRGRDRRGHARVRVARAEERIEIRAHHPPYVAPETWTEIRAILRKNAPSKEKRNLGPGSALLQGILGCGRHRGRSMSVDYQEARRDGSNRHYYHCVGLYEVGGPQCGVVHGRALDTAVAAAVFARLAPPALATIRAEWEVARRERQCGDHAHDRALDQAQRRVDDLRARYAMVSPALRDLAEDLEIQLNEALGTVKHLKAAGGAQRDELTAFFAAEAFDELVALCRDLPTLFYATTTAHRDRKEILRSLVERVLVTAKTAETISATITWTDGSEPTAIEVPLMRFAHRRIAEMVEEGLGNAEIARRLNELGLETSRGKPWSTRTVWQVRFHGARSPECKRQA